MLALIIGNAPREIRGISLKGGQTGSCQIQNPFDRQTYRAEGFYSFHPWLVPCAVWRSPSNSFPIPRTPQRGIFTNISQLKTSHSRGSTRTRRTLECQLTVDFLASFFSRAIRRRASITENAPPRKFDREPSLFASRDSTFATYFTICFIYL